MRLQSSIGRGARIATVCGLALAATFVVTRAKADDWDKKTVLTVKEPIQITDTYLQPGTYVLMLDRDSMSDRHIVRIYNDKQNHLINTVLAIPAYRVRVTGSTQFTFWETPPGTARAMRDWYWPGDNFGQEFPYPTNLKQVSQTTTAPASPAPAPQAEEQQPAPQQQAEVQQPAPQPQAEEQPAAQPQAEVPQQQQQQAEAPEQQQQEEVVIAQATPAPAPPAPEAQPQEQPQAQSQSQPQQLPQTASSYPLAGLVGLFSLSLYGLLRVRRAA
jgi:hypothetical protein